MPGSFTLKVEFTGPCLYVVDDPQPDGGKLLAARVGVVIPDCQQQDTPMEHLDKFPAEPHMAFARLDLGDVLAGIPRGNVKGAPRYELVHRIRRQTIRFVASAAAERIDVTKLGVPEFGRFAPNLTPRANLFSGGADGVLARLVLEGGTLVGDSQRAKWKFSSALNPTKPEYEGEFASLVTWTRKFKDSSLAVSLGDLSDASVQEHVPIDSIPNGAVITLRVGNLCKVNPLDWKELPFKPTPKIDEDFKWLYRLFKPFLVPVQLPAPIHVKGGDETGDDGCMGGSVSGSVPPG
ncbi:MAG: hypothetical protein ACJ8GN_26250 [Longimicrobiaceae bacterium]